ncbi:acyltransferase family protein [Mucilaginibacter ginsenosidivorax]|uniref:Acyltransferase n=1 Tax=Mucilaginibacter ginsenosidivorax TaxID=862126 RepID=A0A5B8W9V2_9SPHI|nr:acyltransferase [Mucilaginibacter ginsenosidivorax]QEC79735.1 acyltransferase [Mucilaginibacter ginsenosidivorax]
MHPPYIKSIDGLRAIAALMVVFFHSPIPIFQFQFGWAGVNIFFILSGFLISRILVASKNSDFKTFLKNFYMRRVLRVFPLYFLYLGVAFLGLIALNSLLKGDDENIKQGLADLRANYPFFLSYTYNFEAIFHYLYQGTTFFQSTFTGHLWTLSVEEQFYCIFPLIIYFLPLEYLKRGCIISILLIPCLRLFSVLYLNNHIHSSFVIGNVLNYFTVFQLDTFAIGIYIALFDTSHILKWWPFIVLISTLVFLSVGIYHLTSLENNELSISSFGFDEPVFQFSYRPPSSQILANRYFYSIPILNLLFGLGLLLLIRKNIAGKFMSNKYLRYIGKISYGIYIYHLGFSYVFLKLSEQLLKHGIQQVSWELQTFFMLIYLSLLILLAGISYKYFEIKFLSFKKNFIYNHKLVPPGKT